MAYENYTIRQFMDALFKDDRSVMDEETFQIVNSEYIDTAELYETDEFQQVAYIHNLNGRINSIKLGIRLQREFLNEFGIPYLGDFKVFKKYGHSVSWHNDKEQFLKLLSKIEKKESKYTFEIENCIKKLTEQRSKKNNNEPQPVKVSRGSFIRTLNSLGKVGYKIDKDKETVEDLAYMIKQQIEESKSK